MCAKARFAVEKHKRGKKGKHKRLRIVAQTPKAGTPVYGRDAIVVTRRWVRAR